MKVLHVIPSLGPVRGGPSFVIRSLAEGLNAAGVEVQVAATDDNGPGRLPVELGRPVEERGVTYWYFPRQTSFYQASAPLSGWLWRQVAKFDLVHIHALFSFAPVAAGLICRARGVPYIVRPLGLLNRWGVQNRRPLLKRCSLRLCEQPILEASKAVHYTSEQERIEAEELGFHAPAAIVPNPVPPVSAAVRGQFRRRLGIPESAPLLLFLSRIDAKKGLDLLIPAFRHVRAALPDAVLVIAGSGDEPLTNRMKALARAEGLDESAIYWPGFVQGAAKEQAFADADLFVLPSYSENFGVAPIEAASAGLPLLLSDHVGVHVEVAAAEAGRVVPCDVTALAREAVELLRAPSLRQSMGEAARALALERYSLEAVSRQMVALYRKVLSQ